ncbi:hypothetical protein GCM10010517_81920 [Streptosporangium fragile]|uniref:Uncharacterized protein n=1 Tax=Streptosporangium fragile TaxID=46186 RepID=A0ABN3WK63_9ACTN
MRKKALPAALAAAALAALTLAPAAPAAAAAGESIQIIHTYTETVKEWSSRFACPANEVMIGRSHYGDENGYTTYRCGRIYINGEQVVVTPTGGDARVKESNSFYNTPGDAAIIGRTHFGDENDYTTYYAGELSWQGKTVRLTSRTWTSAYKESNHSSGAGVGQVMTGRSHRGDENGITKYEYATVTIDG